MYEPENDLRLPPLTLPYVGQTFLFAIFRSGKQECWPHAG